LGSGHGVGTVNHCSDVSAYNCQLDLTNSVHLLTLTLLRRNVFHVFSSKYIILSI
jgi:hypothetical protein